MFFFDVSEFLTNWFLKLEINVLNLMFVFQTFVYGYCAFLSPDPKNLFFLLKAFLLPEVHTHHAKTYTP